MAMGRFRVCSALGIGCSSSKSHFGARCRSCRSWSQSCRRPRLGSPGRRPRLYCSARGVDSGARCLVPQRQRGTRHAARVRPQHTGVCRTLLAVRRRHHRTAVRAGTHGAPGHRFTFVKDPVMTRGMELPPLVLELGSGSKGNPTAAPGRPAGRRRASRACAWVPSARGLCDLALFELRLRSLPPQRARSYCGSDIPFGATVVRWGASSATGRCSGCGEPIGVYERLWHVAPQIGAEPTSWLQPRPCALAMGALWHATCAEADGIPGG